MIGGSSTCEHAFGRCPGLTDRQQENWPYCRGDSCEYRGVPVDYEESIRVGREMGCWEGDFQELYGEMTLEPESLNEVCLFRCLKCDKRMFTWPMT